jgi:hypothetical protein
MEIVKKAIPVGGVTKTELDAVANAAMSKAGGAFTGDVTAAPNTGTAAVVRNIVVVPAGTNVGSLSLSAGTIVMVRK